MADIRHDDFPYDPTTLATPIPCIGAGATTLNAASVLITAANTVVTLSIKVFLVRSTGAAAGFIWAVATFREATVGTTPSQVGPVTIVASNLDADLVGSTIGFTTTTDTVVAYYVQASANTYNMSYSVTRDWISG